MQRTHALFQLLLLLTLSLAARAQFNYTTNNGAITITGYTGAGGTVVIPETVNGFPVTAIGDNAFLDEVSLTSVTVPDTVTSIGIGSFVYCLNLASVALGTNLSSIGFEAFSSCISLSTVSIPNSVTNIGEDAFAEDTSLSYIVIPAGIQSLADDIFTGCTSLTNVTIPDSVTNIGNQVFYGCTSLIGVIIPPAVTSIGNGAFSDCPSLTSVTIPAGVTNIGNFAFALCTSLRGIYFRGTVPGLGSNVFNYDTDATIYYLPVSPWWGPFAATSSVPTAVWQPLAQSADADFGVRSNQFGFNIKWASGMTVIVEACAYPANPVWQPLQTNTLASDSLYFSDPQWVNYSNRFYRVRSSVTPYATPVSQFTYLTNNGAITLTRYTGSATGVVIPSTVDGLPVTTIGQNTFLYEAHVSSVWIPDGVTNIADRAFAECAVSNIRIPSTVSTIGDYAFSVSGLSTLTIPEGATTIGNFAFTYCYSLPNVTLPASLTNIGSAPFEYCTALTAITVDPLNPTYSSFGGVLFNKAQTEIIECPEGKAGTYTIPGRVTNITDQAFADCPNLNALYFQGNAPGVGSSVFQGDSAIVYYLPGTTGWGQNLGGLTTVSWNPQFQAVNASFGIQSSGFGFNITGASNLVVVVVATTNLSHPIWSPIQTNTLAGGSSYFNDPQWTNFPARFYGLRTP